MIAAIALLAACGPTAEEQRVMDMRSCGGFGFAPGTDGFANCMLNVTQQREAQQAADRRASQERQARDAQARQIRDAAAAASAASSTASSTPAPRPAEKQSCTTSTKVEGNTTTTHEECSSSSW